MMVNCPRCGFSQPQDQYCARCGVDMLSFRPAQKPLLRRILGNTFFQLVTLMVLIVAAFSYARFLRHQQIAERIAEVENSQNTQIVSRRMADASKSEFASAAPETLPAQDSPPPPTPKDQESGQATQPAAAPVVASGEAATTAALSQNNVSSASANDSARSGSAADNAQKKPATNARIVFAQVSRAAISDLTANADPRTASSQGNIIFGVVPNAAARLRAVHAEVLDSSSRSLKVNQATEFYGGNREETTGQFLGFVVEVTPTQLDDGESHVQARIWRYLREAGNQVEPFSVPLPESIVIPKGGAAFIAGSLPRRPNMTDLDRQFYEPLKVLRMMAQDDFRSGATELVIFIEPR